VVIKPGPTPTAGVGGVSLLPLPQADNAVLGSPLGQAQPLAPGAAVLLSTSLPASVASIYSVAGVSAPAVHGAAALALASRLGPDFLAAAQGAITATATISPSLSVVGPWNGALYRLTVGAGLEGLTVALDVQPDTLPAAPPNAASIQSSDVVTTALGLLATLNLAHDNLTPIAQSSAGAGGTLSVTFGQTIGNVPILGHDAVTVRLDALGRLLSLRYAYVVTNGGQDYPSRNSVQALTDLRAGAGLYSGPAVSLAVPLEVQSIAVAYVGVQGDAAGGNAYLEPVYVFSGTVRTADGAQSFSAYVPAVFSQAFGE
jgi:hypothetical protein